MRKEPFRRKSVLICG
uniref:Uncharacterized protein n=1 Tax=Rhizophora mucronata TaxID=61149 RepID=A0A2P2MZT2_RHIMU